MGVSNLLYYIFNLIKKGQEWQYQNATRTNHPPKFYFATFQWIALFLSIIFVLTKPSGLNNEIINCLLSSLSIMTGLFLALIVIVYDKFKDLDFNAKDDDEKIEKTKSWNYLCQFNSLTSYAILLSLIVIFILICSLLFGHPTVLSKIHFVKVISQINWILTMQVIFVILIRLLTVYFLLDFFVITIYAISSLFQFINIEMLSQKTPYEITKNKILTDKQTLHKKFPVLSYAATMFIWLTLIAIAIYEYPPMKQTIIYIYKELRMFSH